MPRNMNIPIKLASSFTAPSLSAEAYLSQDNEIKVVGELQHSYHTKQCHFGWHHALCHPLVSICHIQSSNKALTDMSVVRYVFLLS